jgi:hypothetical protein
MNTVNIALLFHKKFHFRAEKWESMTLRDHNLRESMTSTARGG